MKSNTNTAEAAPASCGQHTPIPWHVTADGYDEIRCAFRFLVTGPHFTPGTKAQAVDDSRWIERSCNSHADLLSALRDIADTCANPAVVPDNVVDRIGRVARAAIAIAEGGTQ